MQCAWTTHARKVEFVYRVAQSELIVEAGKQPRVAYGAGIRIAAAEREPGRRAITLGAGVQFPVSKALAHVEIERDRAESAEAVIVGEITFVGRLEERRVKTRAVLGVVAQA